MADRRRPEAESLSSSMEDYLEAIEGLAGEKGIARVKDISEALNVKKPSVTRALNVLSGKGLILHERYGHVELTGKGFRIARDIRARHHTLIGFLNGVLGIGNVMAEKDACRMEHSISPETFKRLMEFMEYVRSCPEKEKPSWLKIFRGGASAGKKASANRRGDEIGPRSAVKQRG